MTSDRTVILERLAGMRSREESTACANYFERASCDCEDGVDAACRGAMVTWIVQVQETLGYRPDTAWIAVSFFDRYLSSGKGRSRDALRSKRQFQLAAIAAFYLAVKIYEHIVLDLDSLVTICRGTYRTSELAETERDILSALGWRVAVHTPMDVAWCLLQLLPEPLPARAADDLLDACRRRAFATLADVASLSRAPSALGIACLRGALRERSGLSHAEQRTRRATLSELCRLDAAFEEAMVDPPRPSQQSPVSVSKLASSFRSTALASASSCDGGDGLSSSLTCVIQAARQA